MTNENRLLPALLICLFCAATAFAQTQTADPKNADTPALQTKGIDLGSLDGTNYTNESFGLSLSTPKDWLLTTGPKDIKDLVKAEGETNRRRVDDSIDRSTILLALTKLPAGEPNNAGFMLIAERTPTPAIKNGLDVIASLKNAMAGTNFKVEFQGSAVTEQINGTDFGVVTIKNSSELGEFMQKIYVMVKGNHALEFFFTYTNPSDLTTLDALMKSANFK